MKLPPLKDDAERARHREGLMRAHNHASHMHANGDLTDDELEVVRRVMIQAHLHSLDGKEYESARANGQLDRMQRLSAPDVETGDPQGDERNETEVVHTRAHKSVRVESAVASAINFMIVEHASTSVPQNLAASRVVATFTWQSATCRRPGVARRGSVWFGQARLGVEWQGKVSRGRPTGRPFPVSGILRQPGSSPASAWRSAWLLLVSGSAAY